MALPDWRPLSSGAWCGKSIGPPPPESGYRLTAEATSAAVQPWLNVPQPWLDVPIRLHNDTRDDLVGWTSHTPWSAVANADGTIVACTTVMRSSMHGLTIPAGSAYDWTASIPLQLCRDRPLGAPREYVSAGTYQLWIDIDIHPDVDVYEVVFTVRGGPLELMLEDARPD